MHRLQFSKTRGAYFVAAWLATVAVACNSPDAVDDCTNRADCHTDGAIDSTVKRDSPLPPDSVVPDTGPSRSPLCGTMGCVPDNPSACGTTNLLDTALFRGARAADDAAGTSDVTNAADSASDASADVVDELGTPDAMGDACPGDGPRWDASDDVTTQDVSVDVTEPDAAEDVGNEPEPDATSDTVEPPTADAGTSDGGGRADAAADVGTDEPRILQSCYMKPGTTGIVTECAPVGAGVEGAACNDSHDCGALLACVEVEQKAVCARITCFLPPDCLKGTYYEEVPLRADGVTRSELKVPACLRTDNCTLLDPQGQCPAGKVCAVVGSAGDTTCMTPGSMKVGEACDETNRCAEGLLCSKFSDQCVKICHIDAGPIDCPTGTCQGGNRSLPDGFGICIGQTDGG